MDINIQRLSLLTFKDLFLEEIIPIANLVFDIYKPKGIKLLTKLCLGLSHLNEDGYDDKFRSEVESASHFF